MMMGENREVKPILLKVGLVLTLSIAGYLYSRNRIRRINQSTGHDSELNLDRAQLKDDIPAIERVSRSCSCNNFSDGHILDTEEPLIKKVISDTTIRSNVRSPPKAYVTPEQDDYDQEMMNLKNIIRVLQERETSLEVQLLEYYDLREKETAVMELQNRLTISNMEAKIFDMKVESLMSENRRLEARMADHAKLVTELECSKVKVKLLKKKIKHEAERNRELIKNLQQRVSQLQDQEDKAGDVQMKLQKLKDLESEAEELRNRNVRLQVENSELARRLDSTQLLANAVLGDAEIIDALKEETERLKRENESLTKEIEQLQADRCSDVEELVYLRWINACLRYELRNYQPPPGKIVARDLSKNLSPTSEKKAKQLILEYANTEGAMDFDSDHWPSSQASSLTDDDDCSSFGNSSVPRIHTSSWSKYFHKLRRLIKGNDRHHHRVQLSPGEKCGSQDSISPQVSCIVSTGNDTCHRSEFATPTRISRISSDFHKLTIMKEEDSTNSDNTEMGSSNKFSLSKGHSADFKNCLGPYSDSVGIEKTPLMKYAEALKESAASSKRSSGRRSASYSSF